MADFDESFDFVVVGSGGGSMCAALAMRQLGKSVLILEKTEYVGGTTARSGGVMWIPNNPFMKRDGVPDSYEKAMTYLDATVGDDPTAKGATRARRQAFVEQGPRMIDFLLGQGIRLTRVGWYPDYYDDRPGGVQAGRTVVAELFDKTELGPWRDKLRPGSFPYPAMLEEMFELKTYKQSWAGKAMMLKVGLRAVAAKLTGKQWVTAGAALQGRMLQAAVKAGVDIRTDSPVGELIEEGGRIVGVTATKGGKPWRVGARLGVLVNAGGFSKNQRMRDKYQPGMRAEWSSGSSSDTGEMIEEMMRHGAAISQMDEVVGQQHTLAPGWEALDSKPGAQMTGAAPHAIVVDRSGLRYASEGGSYTAFCKAMWERNKTVPAVPSWIVFDRRHMDDYMIANTMPGSKKPKSWTESGYLKQADTIEDLAREIGCDPETLTAQVDRFNGYVDRNKDEEFGRGDRVYDHWLGDKYHKPSATLGRIETAPFYAVEMVPGDVGTYGGVVTDTHARVLREDGTPIAGLYATGISTASVMGRVYPGAGASNGPGFTWGYVAAKHAANAGNALP